MTMATFEMISPGPDRVGESPVWDRQQRALWWVDIESRRIRRWRAADGALHHWIMPQRVGCIALCARGGLIAALEEVIVWVQFDPEGQMRCTDLARIHHPVAGMRFNDGRCDPAGRLWVGTMVMDMPSAQAQGGWYCLDERGLTGPHIRGLYTPNGSGFSPEGNLFYWSDSHPLSQQVWVADFDQQTGTIAHARGFIDMRDWPGRPDGAAVDAEGHYWVCGNDAGVLHRVSPAGLRVDTLRVPFVKPAMCCFGGDDGATLFVTSIVPANHDGSDLSGAVVALRPGVQGQPEPLFSRLPAALSGG